MSLNLLEVDEPCTESWDAMRGQGDVRFCGTCRMNVYNLSEMTAEDASRLIERQNGELCVRFYRRADGTVTTADCQPARFAAVTQRMRQILLSAGVVLTGVFSAALGAAFFLGRDEESPCSAETAPAAQPPQQIEAPMQPVQPLQPPPPVVQPPVVQPPVVETSEPPRQHLMGRMMIRR